MLHPCGHATVPQTGIIKRERGNVWWDHHLELNATGQGIYLLSLDLRHKLAIARLGLIGKKIFLIRPPATCQCNSTGPVAVADRL